MTDNLLAFKGLADILIPITRFNRGEASKIFDEVNKSGVKIVLKNNLPVGVIIQPERYDELMEMLEDLLLYQEADKRMSSTSANTVRSEAEVMASLGISDTDLDNSDDVEID